MTKQISNVVKSPNLIVLVIGVIMVVFIGIRISDDKDSSPAYGDEAVRATASVSLDSQSNGEGDVTVSATLIDQSDWSFEMSLTTHSVDMREDLTQVSILVDENGNEYKPIEWQGDPPGGHHRGGVLRFGEITPSPRSVALIVRQVGGVEERVFEWTPLEN